MSDDAPISGNEPALPQPVDNSPGIKREWDVVKKQRIATAMESFRRMDAERLRREAQEQDEWVRLDRFVAGSCQSRGSMNSARQTEEEAYLNITWIGARPFVPPDVLHNVKWSAGQEFGVDPRTWRTLPVMLYGDWRARYRDVVHMALPVYRPLEPYMETIERAAYEPMRSEAVPLDFRWTVSAYGWRWAWRFGFARHAHVLVGALAYRDQERAPLLYTGDYRDW